MLLGISRCVTVSHYAKACATLHLLLSVNIQERALGIDDVLLCLICPSLYTALSYLYWYISTKIDTADIYSTYRVPELTVDGFVELSSLDYLIKSCMCLAANVCVNNDVCGALQT